MMECGLGKGIMYRMADHMVKEWVSQGITDLNDFHTGEDGKTPVELADMVGGLVDDYLVSLLGYRKGALPPVRKLDVDH